MSNELVKLAIVAFGVVGLALKKPVIEVTIRLWCFAQVVVRLFRPVTPPSGSTSSVCFNPPPQKKSPPKLTTHRELQQGRRLLRFSCHTPTLCFHFQAGKIHPPPCSRRIALPGRFVNIPATPHVTLDRMVGELPPAASRASSLLARGCITITGRQSDGSLARLAIGASPRPDKLLM